MSWHRYLVIVVVLAMPLATLGVLQPTQRLGAQDASPATAQAQVRTQLDVTIPMRDGVRLAADIYRPEGTGPFPVLLSRTPYNKRGAERDARFFAQHGYAVVIVDSRGLYGSEGEWRPYLDEGQDGYDTQQWIGQQPWSNGTIGMFGRSYPGFTQLLPAPYRSPYVKAIMPEAAQSDNYGSIWSTNGLYHLALALSWGTQQEAIARDLTMPLVNWSKVLNHLPLNTALDEIGIRSSFVAATISHDTYDDFWKQMSIRHRYSEIDVPALHVSGWYDDLISETFVNFTNMRARSPSEQARRWQKLIVGPWGHGVRNNPRYGDVDFGPEMAIELQALRLRWFDYHLKGSENGLEREAPVRIFVMGANKWRDEYEWPLSRARVQELYLHSDGGANAWYGDGRLDPQAPAAEPPDRYRYDPRYPVPTWGGHGCCGGGRTPDGPLDQRSVQQRQDVLVYTSDPLEQDTEVTGRVAMRLFFSTDVVDTDFFVTLSDVHPDGRAILITEGGMRTRFRDSLEEPTLLTPARVYQVEIPLWETSNLFKTGHRIRVHVTSSNFPRFNRNLNSGKPLGEETEDDIRVATQSIYHDRVRPSAILLPVIP